MGCAPPTPPRQTSACVPSRLKTCVDRSLGARLRCLMVSLGQMVDAGTKHHCRFRQAAVVSRNFVLKVSRFTQFLHGHEHAVVIGCVQVLVDEASHGTEPECLIPIMTGAVRVCLVGDQNQLGPVVTCERAAKAGLNVSLYTRLVRASLCVVGLCDRCSWFTHGSVMAPL